MKDTSCVGASPHTAQVRHSQSGQQLVELFTEQDNVTDKQCDQKLYSTSINNIDREYIEIENKMLNPSALISDGPKVSQAPPSVPLALNGQRQ